MMSQYGLYNRFEVKEGERDTMVEILLEAAESMENLEDCEVYIVSVSEADPTSIFVYEVWKDEEAHRASLTLDATQRLIKRAKPIIAGVERISTVRVEGGKIGRL